MKTLEETKNDCLIVVADLEEDIKIVQDAIGKIKKTILAAKTIDDLKAADDIVDNAIEKTPTAHEGGCKDGQEVQ